MKIYGLYLANCRVKTLYRGDFGFLHVCQTVNLCSMQNTDQTIREAAFSAGECNMCCKNTKKVCSVGFLGRATEREAENGYGGVVVVLVLIV